MREFFEVLALIVLIMFGVLFGVVAYRWYHSPDTGVRDIMQNTWEGK